MKLFSVLSNFGLPCDIKLIKVVVGRFIMFSSIFVRSLGDIAYKVL